MSNFNRSICKRIKSPKTAISDRSPECTNSNSLDDFFGQPSAHEFSAVGHLSSSSESRISEIIADLQRQTNEELEWWSSGSNHSTSMEKRNPEQLSHHPSEPDLNNHMSPSSLSNGESTSQQKTTDTNILPGRGLVSSPVSFLSPSSTKLSSSNLAAVLKSKLSIHRPKRVAKHFTIVSLPPTYITGQQQQQARATPLSPVKPSFQSFLKRVPSPSLHQAALTAEATAKFGLGSGHNRFSFEPEEQEALNTSMQKAQQVPKRKALPSDSPLFIQALTMRSAEVSKEMKRMEDLVIVRCGTAPRQRRNGGEENYSRLLRTMLPLPLTPTSPA